MLRLRWSTGTPLMFSFLNEVRLTHNVTIVAGIEHSDLTVCMYYAMFTTRVVTICHYSTPLQYR